MNRSFNRKFAAFAVAVAVSAFFVLQYAHEHQHDDGLPYWVAPAEAQVTFSATKNGTTSWGLVQPVWNTVDSTITDGDIVMWDTTSVVKRQGVRHYLGALADRKRIAGIAYGDISKSSLGGRGAILLYGWHNNIKFATPSGSVGFAPLRISATTGSVKDAGDSMSMQIGTCTGGTAGLAGTMAHIKGYVNFVHGALTGSL